MNRMMLVASKWEQQEAWRLTQMRMRSSRTWIWTLSRYVRLFEMQHHAHQTCSTDLHIVGGCCMQEADLKPNFWFSLVPWHAPAHVTLHDVMGNQFIPSQVLFLKLGA